MLRTISTSTTHIVIIQVLQNVFQPLWQRNNSIFTSNDVVESGSAGTRRLSLYLHLCLSSVSTCVLRKPINPVLLGSSRQIPVLLCKMTPKILPKQTTEDRRLLNARSKFILLLATKRSSVLTVRVVFCKRIHEIIKSFLFFG